MTAATESFWKSTHPMGDDIRIGDLRVLSIVALACGMFATVTATTMFVMVQRVTRGVYLVAISSMLIATLITPFFVGTGISVIVAGPDFDGTSNPWFTTPSVAGCVLTPLVAVAVGFLGNRYDKRTRSSVHDAGDGPEGRAEGDR